MVATPSIEPDAIEVMREGTPWERAIHDARALRQKIGNICAPMLDNTLHELLGISRQDSSKWALPTGRMPEAVAVPVNNRRWRFIPRRRSAAGRRFELARFTGEYLSVASRAPEWLVSTDLSVYLTTCYRNRLSVLNRVPSVLASCAS